MPSMPRIPGKATKIAFDVMGPPANFPKKRRKKSFDKTQDNRVEQELDASETRFVR